MIETLVTLIHVATCVFLILVILLQSGKGGGVSAAFGGGAGAALGQRAAATVLGKLTAAGAFIFMLTSMTLAVYSSPSATDPTKDYNPGAGVSGAPADAEKKGEAPAQAEEQPAAEAPKAAEKPAEEAPKAAPAPAPEPAKE